MDLQEKINRIAFLKELGLKGASLMAVCCSADLLSSCTNEQTATPSQTGELLKIDLTATPALQTVGGYIRQNNVVLARVSTTKYVAVTQFCSHEGRTDIIYTNNQFYCTAHGASYDQNGAGLNSTGRAGIKAFTVSISGNILTVSN